MNLKLNGNGNGQPKPYLKIALLAVAVILVGLLVYRQVDRLSGPKRSVWVAKGNLAQGAVLGRDDFVERSVRESKIPAGAVEDLSKVIGRRLARVKPAGAPLVATDFGAVNGDSGSIARLVPEGRVLMTLTVGARSLPLSELRRGDRLNLLAVSGRGDSGSVARDAYFVGWIRPQESGGREKASIFGIDLAPPGRPPSNDTVSLLLALLPEDVARVARAEAARYRINVVLHGRTEVQEGRLLELPSPRRTQVELISGGKRQNVALLP